MDNQLGVRTCRSGGGRTDTTGGGCCCASWWLLLVRWTSGMSIMATAVEWARSLCTLWLAAPRRRAGAEHAAWAGRRNQHADHERVSPEMAEGVCV